jgi:hypothetical protein
MCYPTAQRIYRVGILDTYFCLVDGISSCWTFGEPAPRLAATASNECVRDILGFCFVVPPEGKGGIFGFAEFVQAFALLVLIFTVTGARYQFRIDSSPIRLWSLTYWGAGAIGALALLSDLWFANAIPCHDFYRARHIGNSR